MMALTSAMKSLKTLTLAALLAPLMLLAGQAAAQTAPAGGQAAQGPSVAGTYRIQDGAAREAQGMYQFFYLHPNGTFLLAAEWRDKETSKIVGRWMLRGNQLMLRGKADVVSNIKAYQGDFSRSYRVSQSGAQVVLTPVPEKNAYGLMGWPTAFNQASAKPASNLPKWQLPTEEGEMAKVINQLLGQ